jgi:hypothetical protein
MWRSITRWRWQCVQPHARTALDEDSGEQGGLVAEGLVDRHRRDAGPVGHALHREAGEADLEDERRGRVQHQ